MNNLCTKLAKNVATLNFSFNIEQIFTHATLLVSYIESVLQLICVLSEKHPTSTGFYIEVRVHSKPGLANLYVKMFELNWECEKVPNRLLIFRKKYSLYLIQWGSEYLNLVLVLNSCLGP